MLTLLQYIIGQSKLISTHVLTVLYYIIGQSKLIRIHVLTAFHYFIRQSKSKVNMDVINGCSGPNLIAISHNRTVQHHLATCLSSVVTWLEAYKPSRQPALELVIHSGVPAMSCLREREKIVLVKLIKVV